MDGDLFSGVGCQLGKAAAASKNAAVVQSTETLDRGQIQALPPQCSRPPPARSTPPKIYLLCQDKALSAER